MKGTRKTTANPGNPRTLFQRVGAGAGDRLRLEADGLTHRRDCECARCEAGFTPTERERAVAGRRLAEKRGRQAAARAMERRREKSRLAQLDLQAYFRQTNAAADAEVARLRALRAKVLADRRVEELLRLRTEGWELGAALAEVERRLGPESPHGADNDNARVARVSSAGAGAAADGPHAFALFAWAQQAATARPSE